MLEALKYATSDPGIFIGTVILLGIAAMMLGIVVNGLVEMVRAVVGAWKAPDPILSAMGYRPDATQLADRPACHVCDTYLTRVGAIPIDDDGHPTAPPGAAWVCNACDPIIYYRDAPTPSAAQVEGKPAVDVHPLDA